MNKLALVAFLVAVIVGYNFYDDFDPGVLEGKRVLVTGASTGIGEQLAYHYARLGAKVLITARREQRLKEVVAKCHELGSADGSYHYISADMSNMGDTKRVIGEARSVLGGLDYLVLNHIALTPFGEWRGSADNFTTLDKILDINFKAYVHLTSHALDMLEASSGSIVVVSSLAGRISQPFLTPYSTSKFALDGFFSGLRQELYGRDVDVSVTLCILGLISTDNAISNLRRHGYEFILDAITAADAGDTALAIIKGGAVRAREVYFPYLDVRPITILRDWMPNIIETILRIMYSRS